MTSTGSTFVVVSFVLARPPTFRPLWADFGSIYYCQFFFRRDIDLLPIQTKAKRSLPSLGRWGTGGEGAVVPPALVNSRPSRKSVVFRMLVLLKYSHLFYSLQMRILQLLSLSLGVLELYPAPSSIYPKFTYVLYVFLDMHATFLSLILFSSLRASSSSSATFEMFLMNVGDLWAASAGWLAGW